MSKVSLVGLVVFCLSSLAVAEDISPNAPKANPLAMIRADHIMISTADYVATLD